MLRTALLAAWSATSHAKLGCTPPGCLCSDDCKFSRDGECDDSGPDSDSAQCGLGSDCHDCGERTEEVLGTFVCTNKCFYRRDGQCDDGGPGAKLKTCGFGSDCADCGPRMAGATCDGDKVKVCGSGCMFASDGHCDDGGPGSWYNSCTFASDCEDCGPREQPCGAAAAAADAYEASELSPPPPPSPCKGGGEPRCDPQRCNMFLHAETTDCGNCECAACVFCVQPEGLAFPPPPLRVSSPSPRPPPPPSPPFAFDCSMLEGRSNARHVGHFCYSLSLDACSGAYTYVQGDNTDAGLSLCRPGGDGCESMHIPAAKLAAAGGCIDELRMPPSMPPSPPPPPEEPASPMPLSPPLPAPPAAPPPPPCVPLSGKCGGTGWGGLTNCCDHVGMDVQCYKKNAHHSQCRASCNLPGWECATPPPQQQSPSPAPPPAALAPSPAPPSPARGSPATTHGEPHVAPTRAAPDAVATKVGRAKSGSGNGQPPATAAHQVESTSEGEAQDSQADEEQASSSSPSSLSPSASTSPSQETEDLFGLPRVQMYALGAAVLLVLGNLMGCAFVCCCCSARVQQHRGAGYPYSKNVSMADVDDMDDGELASRW